MQTQHADGKHQGAAKAQGLARQPSPEDRGCCFSIGYGDLFRPCCLKAEADAARASCKRANRPFADGALRVGFTIGACPTTPLDAAEVLKQIEELPASTGPGCCISVRFHQVIATISEPCCLNATRAPDDTTCPLKKHTSGFSGFHNGACPKTAAEGTNLLMSVYAEQNPSMNSISMTQGARVRFASASQASSIAIVLLMFSFLGCLAVIAVRWTRLTQMATEFLRPGMSRTLPAQDGAGIALYEGPRELALE